MTLLQPWKARLEGGLPKGASSTFSMIDTSGRKRCLLLVMWGVDRMLSSCEVFFMSTMNLQRAYSLEVPGEGLKKRPKTDLNGHLSCERF